MKKAKNSLIRLEDVICSGVFVKMQNFFRNFIKNSYIYFLIFLLGLGLRIYALSTYPPLHIDEPCTFAVSTSASELDKGIRFKKSWNDFAFRYGQEYSSQEIQRAFSRMLFLALSAVSSAAFWETFSESAVGAGYPASCSPSQVPAWSCGWPERSLNKCYVFFRPGFYLRGAASMRKRLMLLSYVPIYPSENLFAFLL